MENSIIDCHLHIWDIVNHDMKWIKEESEFLYKNSTIPEFLESSKKVPNKRCVLVQVRQSYEETDWYLKLAEENEFIVGVVGWVDLKDEKLRERIQEYKKNKYFNAVRHQVEHEKDVNWLIQPDVLKGLGILEEENVPYELLIRYKHFDIAEDVIKKFPKMTFVIEHLAKPSIDVNDLEEWTNKMKRFVAYPNVYCKISALTTLADEKKSLNEQIVPYMKRTIELFGSKRCLFGSDWPICLLASKYEEVYELMKSSLQTFSQEEQEDVWFKTATRLYKLSQ